MFPPPCLLLQAHVQLWPQLRARVLPVVLPDDVPEQPPAPKRVRTAAVAKPPVAVPARPSVELDGAQETEVFRLAAPPTWLSGSDAKLACGGTTHYGQARLLVPGGDGRAEMEARVTMPIRARHAVRGEGYLGLIAHLPASRKAKPLFLPSW